MGCPRCLKTKYEHCNYNTFIIDRMGHKVPMNKCKVCGFLWIEDCDMIELASWEVKKRFIEDVRSLGRTNQGNNRKTNRKGRKTS